MLMDVVTDILSMMTQYTMRKDDLAANVIISYYNSDLPSLEGQN